MSYEFPIIQNISDVLPAIEDRDEIIVAERPHFNVIDYQVAFADSFPDPTQAGSPYLSVHHALRRECRGLKFHPETGEIMARPYHKFFNVDEKEETQHNAIDWSQEFIILEKLDGSMNHPIFTDSGEMHMCTRMGMTDVAAQADQYVASTEIPYYDFCKEMHSVGITPIFEWCSRKQRIVILYQEDQLVLTGARHMVTGKYMSYDSMRGRAGHYGIPVVNRWRGTFGEIERFMEEEKSRQDEEGNVFRFDSGHMYKCKNDWYCQIHRSKDEIRFEKNIIRLHLEGNLDDVIPHLLSDDAARVESFVADFDAAVEGSIHRLKDSVDQYRSHLSHLDVKEQKKQFAEHVVSNYTGMERAMLFAIWDGHAPLDVVIKAILDKTFSQTQVDSVRFLFDISWYDY